MTYPTKRPYASPAITLAACLMLLGVWMFAASSARADDMQGPPVSSQSGDTYQESEIVAAATNFFGAAAQGMGDAVHSVFKEYGEPNAYIEGKEGSGAFIVGLRYGQGELIMKRGGRTQVYWQGPSAGWDFGGDAAKVFTLIYNLPEPSVIFQRYPGIEGSAYLVGGIGINYQQRDNIILAPMRAGAGLRLGAAVGYLKYTRERTWLPF